MLTNFLSNKNNLTLLQCLLYGVLGYLLKGNYNWTQFIIVFIILFGIQFITHIKGISQGMVMLRIMEDSEEHRHSFMEFVKRIKKLDDDNDLPN